MIFRWEIFPEADGEIDADGSIHVQKAKDLVSRIKP
jgi:hypothetical protein